MDTGSGTHMSPMVHMGPISPESWPGKRLSMFPEAGMKRTGVFSCTAGSGRNTEIIQAIKIGTSGGIWPEKFTVTVNVGENVYLKFLSHDDKQTVWRHHGQVIPQESDMVHSISSISKSHAGIYECYSAPRDKHSIQSYRPSDQGIMRLIVRECAEGRWNPPYCGRTCKCKNGGFCDDKTGECVCPPGFKGTNCESACGGNRFGADCQFSCKQGGSSYGEDAEECKSRQFCLPDPYGCSCGTGFQGLECSEGCTLGSYGADCKQECHCKRPDLCNRFTGSCTMGCAAGWMGPSCQEECEPGAWGENCEQKCHCDGDVPCDKVNGKCPGGQCAHPFTGRSCQTDVIDECESNPCQHGGTCTDRVLLYECTCVNGTTGKSCEIDIDDCQSSPCKNGGSCIDDGILKFKCECQPGFIGRICETDIDDCQSNRCDNGATCVDKIDDYSCSCKSGYIGKYCEEICPPGSYYDDKFVACSLCDITSYQDKPGQAFCIPCPMGTETQQNGTTSVSECLADNILQVNASVDSLIFIIVGIVGALIVVGAGVLIWYYGYHKKKNRLERVTIRRAW
uniref:multiple epidermal growth factor-like domains protein 11 n=1 Tax=Styela clava TaxID=7725 RepID=UPI00193AB3FB|nr:multiple epidermal growth factor-like domains protein 11 [Styela clava]